MIAAITLFVLLGAVSGDNGNGPMAAPYDTIIVGLGAAGCTAASTLAQAGRKVLALEAQDRLGGRVNTVPFGDGVVELGAEWIHGTHPSRVYDLAIQHNVTVIPQDLSHVVYRSDGSLADQMLINELVNFSLAVVDDPPKVPEPLGQYIIKRVTAYIRDKYPHILNDQEFMDEFFQFMDLIIDNYESSNSWNDVTTQSKYEELGGHQHMSWHRYGYKTLFEILMNTYNNGVGYPTIDIKLNTEVTQISWPQDPTKPVEVTCKDGSKYTANNVIVTVSLGVLKERHATLFSPKLPKQKINIIDNLSIGVVDKIVLSFDKPWWPANTTFVGFLWKRDNKCRVGADDYWITQIFGASCSKGSGNTMTLWTSGNGAKLVETLPEDVVRRKVMDVLRMFMGTNMTIPEPTGMIRSTWYSNPFTRGSYTYDNIQTPQYPNARVDLGEPLLDAAGKPRVLFAGEATNPTHFSTVHGATDTGYREAMRLLPITSKI